MNSHILSRSNSSLMSSTDLRRTMSWDMNEDLAMNHQQIHLSPELTQLSFEMSRNYFLDYILRDQTGESVHVALEHDCAPPRACLVTPISPQAAKCSCSSSRPSTAPKTSCSGMFPCNRL
jgi:hypothetical protein